MNCYGNARVWIFGKTNQKWRGKHSGTNQTRVGNTKWDCLLQILKDAVWQQRNYVPWNLVWEHEKYTITTTRTGYSMARCSINGPCDLCWLPCRNRFLPSTQLWVRKTALNSILRLWVEFFLPMALFKFQMVSMMEWNTNQKITIRTAGNYARHVGSMAARPRLVVHFYPFVIQRMRRGKNDQHCVVLEEQKHGDG